MLPKSRTRRSHVNKCFFKHTQAFVGTHCDCSFIEIDHICCNQLRWVPQDTRTLIRRAVRTCQLWWTSFEVWASRRIPSMQAACYLWDSAPGIRSLRALQVAWKRLRWYVCLQNVQQEFVHAHILLDISWWVVLTYLTKLSKVYTLRALCAGGRSA